MRYLTTLTAALALLAAPALAQDTAPDATGTLTKTADGIAAEYVCNNVAPDGSTLMCTIVEADTSTDLVIAPAGRLPAEGSVLADIMADLPSEIRNLSVNELKAAMPCSVTQARQYADKDDVGCLMGGQRYWVLLTAYDEPLPWSASGETPITYVVSISDNETGAAPWYNIGPNADGVLVIDGEG